MNRIEKFLPIILSLLLPGLSIISNRGNLTVEETIPKYFVIVFFLYACWRLNTFLMDRPEKFIVKLKGDKLMILVTILINTIFIGIFVVVDYFLLPSWLRLSSSVPVWIVIIRLTMASFIFWVFQHALKATKRQESLYAQNLLLQTEKLKSELETMKQQINPHFLFNSLNTLIDLIEENQKKAVGFVRVFSNLYRVVLQSSRRDFVLLEDELLFLNDYWELLKIRFNDAVHLSINIPKEKRKVLIPPLSLQMLIENAVKHNSATNEKPLFIEVYVTSNTLVIKNNINMKPYVSHSEGLGLINLQKRFTMLVAPIMYGVDHDEFKVILPIKEI